ncbi:hypothetical protein [Pseudomonas syringae]|uniref:hypothetical protein n=1 Tax=Pseudomonas syringae TaxID=317 RepID=UPI000B2B360A|nr:Transcriptional regulator, LysR family [Pseudomonas syringae pv. papulans]RMN63924.1 Transcriptional regulator, LysR family [Pseudomonas syringae pv. papulans]RMV42149.1 Transcriptional regulator, LysR family [Pseudomonas syringae pv. papulans]
MRTRLFQRTTRRLSLTEAGETFYRTCTTVVSDLQEVEIALTSTQTEHRARRVLIGQLHLNSGRLVEVLLDLATEGLPMSLVWLRSREALPKVSALSACLGANLTPAGRVGR